jgi:hypothetical protein
MGIPGMKYISIKRFVIIKIFSKSIYTGIGTVIANY